MEGLSQGAVTPDIYRADEVGKLLEHCSDGLADKLTRHQGCVLKGRLNNAERRLAQSLNDDAIQRAYRATELLAQIPFAEFDPPIDAAGPIPIAQFPEEVQAKWACRADGEGRLRLGLTDLYALLLDLGHPLGEWFAADEQQPLQWALTARNQTILAHGFTAARTEDVRTILDSIGPKAAAMNKRIAQWREQAQFQRVDLSPTVPAA